MIYSIPIILSFVGVFCFDFKSHYNLSYRKFLWITILLISIAIIGLRYKVGGDTLAYMNDYIWRKPLTEWKFTFVDSYQPAYTFLCAIGKSISSEFYVFQIIHATIFNSLLFVFLYKNTRYIFSALIGLFLSSYLYFSTEILREILAVMIFAFNYKNLKDEKWIKYYLGVFISICFHISAIFLILIPLFRKLKFNSTYFLVTAILSIVLLESKPILNAIGGWTIFMGKIDVYIDMNSTGFLSDFLQLCRYFFLPLFFGMLCRYKLKKEIAFENMVAIFSLIGLASFFNFIIFGRLLNYFILFFIMSIVEFSIPAIKSHKKNLRQIGSIITITYFILFSSGNLMYGKYTRWYPYYSIFNPISINRDNYDNIQ